MNRAGHAAALLGAVLCVAAALPAAAAEFTPYVFSRPEDRPRSSVGLQLRASHIEVSGNVTAEARGAQTHIAPNFSTRVALAPKVSVETRLEFAGWNGRAALLDESAVETKLRASTPLPLVREIESSFWRGPDGSVRQRVGVGLVENLGLELDRAGRIKLNTQAIFEQTAYTGQADVQVSGLQASLSGFAAFAPGVDSRLSLRYEMREADRLDGSYSERTGTVSYHRGWRVNQYLRLTVDCEYVDAQQTESRVLVGWHAEF